MPAPKSCYGCLFLDYRGPVGVLPESEIPEEDSGEYRCRKFGTRVAHASEAPRPLKPGCKRVSS